MTPSPNSTHNTPAPLPDSDELDSDTSPSREQGQLGHKHQQTIFFVKKHHKKLL